jgi:hypothetical protein
MTTATLDSANDTLRDAVAARMAATDPSDPKLAGYRPPILAGCKPAEECAADLLSRATSCCDGARTVVSRSWDNAEMAKADAVEQFRMRGDSLMKSDVHPTSQEFFDLCDALKEMHRKKSRDYGCPSGEDPLANIRNGAKFVGIPSWKGAMVRLSDKVTRLAAYNATGRLENESLEDNLFDLASYSLLALLLHREEQCQ